MTTHADPADNAAAQSYGALLFRPDPTGQVAVIMDRVCDLSDADYRRYSDAYKVMSDLFVANMFTYVRQSAIDLMRLAEEASIAFRDGEISPTRPDDAIEWATKLRTAVLAFCSSIHHHQDQSYIEVIRKFGEDSDEHVAMKAAFAEIYDDCFGYRYLYKMRNTMVHFTMLTAAMKAEAANYNGEPVGFVDMRMDRSALIEQKRHLNQKLRDELNGLEEDPSIYEMAGEALPHLRDTNRCVLEILHPDLDDVCGIVREFDALFDGRPGIRALIHQQSPELRAPFTTGYKAWADSVIKFARSREQDGDNTNESTAD